MIRRRLAVAGVGLGILLGEWLGHSVAYYRVAGVAGLEAGLSGGIHDYMLPFGVLLVLAATAGAAAWTRAWLALGRRLDSSVALLPQMLRGDPRGALGVPPRAPAPQRTPSLPARIVALALPMALVQSALYLFQENVERSTHRLPAPGIRPLLDGFGSALWIQAAVALVIAGLLMVALRLLGSRHAAALRVECLAHALWQRRRRATSAAQPQPPLLVPAQLLLRSAMRQRPPPVLTAS